jgi:hypothetical protein
VLSRFKKEKVQSPLSVKGSPARERFLDLRAQQKAEEELESLLKSQSPLAGARAAATGLVAGSALPLMMSSVLPWAGSVGDQVDRLRQQAHLAHLIQERTGTSEDEARKAAAGAYRYLMDTDTVHPAVRKALGQGEQLRVRPDFFEHPKLGKLFRFVDAKGPEWGIPELEHRFGAEAKKQGVTIEEMFYHKVPLDSLPSSAKPSPTSSREVMRAAKESFEAAGKKVRVGRGLAESLSASVRRGLPAALPFGAVAAVGSYANHRRRKKRLRTLEKDAAALVSPALRLQKLLEARQALERFGRPRSKPSDIATTPILIQKRASVAEHCLDELTRIEHFTAEAS